MSEISDVRRLFSPLYPYVKIHKPTADTVEKILQKICIDAANVLDRQTGGGAVLTVAKKNLLKKVNCTYCPKMILLAYLKIIDVEHRLSVFGMDASVAHFHNKKFTVCIFKMTWPYSSPKHFKMLQIKTSMLQSSYWVACKRNGLMNKSSFKQQNFWTKLINPCAPKNVFSFEKVGIRQQQVLMNWERF